MTQNNLAIRPDLHLAFKLGAGGESILLSAPDGSLIDRVDFGSQSPDKTMGRVNGGIFALATPSPNEANGSPALNPVASFSVNGSLITLNATAEPGFLYILEVTQDLVSWTQVGGSILATGNTVTFTDNISADQRFYRFRRIP